MSDTEQIKSVLNAYRNFLVRSNAEGCASLYTENGVTMAQHFPSQIGKSAVQKWYNLCFSLITLDVTFDIKEVVVVSGAHAFARTTSAGFQTKAVSEEQSKESNQELFVLEKENGEWKIARYCFCTTNPPVSA